MDAPEPRTETLSRVMAYVTAELDTSGIAKEPYTGPIGHLLDVACAIGDRAASREEEPAARDALAVIAGHWVEHLIAGDTA
jgi:hypothetical protein